MNVKVCCNFVYTRNTRGQEWHFLGCFAHRKSKSMTYTSNGIVKIERHINGNSETRLVVRGDWIYENVSPNFDGRFYCCRNDLVMTISLFSHFNGIEKAQKERLKFRTGINLVESHSLIGDTLRNTTIVRKRANSDEICVIRWNTWNAIVNRWQYFMYSDFHFSHAPPQERINVSNWRVEKLIINLCRR